MIGGQILLRDNYLDATQIDYSKQHTRLLPITFEYLHVVFFPPLSEYDASLLESIPLRKSGHSSFD